MHIRHCAALGALALAAISCSEQSGPTGTATFTAEPAVSAAATQPAVRISEIHYDNAGTDVGEAIEISGPAGTDLAGWQLVLYNGSGGAPYTTTPLSGIIAASCGARGVTVVSYPTNGIQNGSPDGVALVDPTGTVVEFLSYEGTFVAVGGPADGQTSIDIGVSESSTTPSGESLQRLPGGIWSGPSASTFGSCTDAGDDPPPGGEDPPPALPPTRIVELHYDNAGTDVGEAIEIEGPAGTDLAGWSVVLYNGSNGEPYDTQALSGVLADQCAGRGVVVINLPSNGLQNGSPDGLALVNAAGEVVEFLSYEGTLVAASGPAAGLTSVDIGVSESSSTPIGQSLQRNAAGRWEGPAAASFGGCNGSGEVPPAKNFITFSGRTASDPPLPIGFQDQLFATVRDPGGTALATSVSWSSDTPDLAGIDGRGVVTAFAAGTAVLRATAEDGTTGTVSLPTHAGTASPTAEYAAHDEFGLPADGDPADDQIVRRAEYVASFDRVRGIPNWVSYNLEASHFGPADRCDCFTFDPALPVDFTRYTTADYTGASDFHGYRIDRGHLVRSADRTAGSLDNAATYYFTNIVPQAADVNQRAWAALESHLGDRARGGADELFIVTGASGSKGTVKDEGVITIPSHVWKVAVIVPRNTGRTQITSEEQLEVIAVIMPNEPGAGGEPWESYRTTVDAVEALSGYDLLALLRDDIELAVESGTSRPVARLDGPYELSEGGVAAMSAAASSDADGDALTYEWTFGDGESGSGVTVEHRYPQDGVYPVRLIVSDALGLADTIASVASVANVAPALAPIPAATLLPFERYTATGAFSDPGADPWTATVDYGDGTGPQPLPLDGMSFALSHIYENAGSYRLTVRVTDDDATGERSQTITVLAWVQVVDNAIALVREAVADGRLGRGEGTALIAKLQAVRKMVDRASPGPAAANVAAAVLHQIDALIRSGRLTDAEAAAVRGLIERLIRSVG